MISLIVLHSIVFVAPYDLALTSDQPQAVTHLFLHQNQLHSHEEVQCHMAGLGLACCQA